MADSSVASCRAEIDIVWCTDSQGRVIGLPAAMVEGCIRQGQYSVELVICMPGAAPHAEWLTVTAAAAELLDDVDGISLHAARVRVVRACERGELRCAGTGRARRIEPVSFRAWRLHQRNLNLGTDPNSETGG